MIDKSLLLCGGDAAVVQEFPHLAAELAVVLVGGAGSRWRAPECGADAGEAGDDDVVTEDDGARDSVSG
jgi:hypothetical protein